MSNKSLVTALVVGLLIGSVAFTAQAATKQVDAKLTLKAPLSGTIEIGKTQKVSWSSAGTAPATVKMNLIRKVGSNPARYELVRTVAVATKNDGSATWVPAKTDVGANLSLEIGCAPSKIACVGANSTAKLIAVVNSSKYANAAAAYKALEAKDNK